MELVSRDARFSSCSNDQIFHSYFGVVSYAILFSNIVLQLFLHLGLWDMYSITSPVLHIHDDRNGTNSSHSTIDRTKQRSEENNEFIVPISLCIPSQFVSATIFFPHLTLLLDSLKISTKHPQEIIFAISEVPIDKIEKLRNVIHRMLLERNINSTLLLDVTDRHRHVSLNRIIAFSASSCPVVSFIDCDDQLHPQRLEIIHFVFHKYDIDFLTHSYHRTCFKHDRVWRFINEYVNYRDPVFFEPLYHDWNQLIYNYLNASVEVVTTNALQDFLARHQSKEKGTLHANGHISLKRKVMEFVKPFEVWGEDTEYNVRVLQLNRFQCKNLVYSLTFYCKKIRWINVMPMFEGKFDGF